MGRRVAGAQPGPQRAAAGAPVGAVGAQGGIEPAQRELPGVLRGEGGVVQGAPLVDVAVDVGGRYAGGAQRQEIRHQPIVLVNRRRARVAGHLGPGLDGDDGIGGEHVRRQEVVEHAEGVGEGVVAPRRVRAGDPAHQHHDVGLVDRHPAPAVRSQRGQHALHVAGEAVRGAGSQPELLAQPVRVGEVVEGDHGLEAARGAHLEDLDVAVQGGLVERGRPRAPGGPTRRRGGTWCTRWRPPGPTPPRGGPRNRRPRPNAPPDPCAPIPPSCWPAARGRCTRPRSGSPPSPRRWRSPCPKVSDRRRDVGGRPAPVGSCRRGRQARHTAWQVAPVPPRALALVGASGETQVARRPGCRDNP